MEENEILNIGTAPEQNLISNNIFLESEKTANALLDQVNRKLNEPLDSTPTIEKVKQAKDALKPNFPTLDEVIGPRKPQQTISQKEIDDKKVNDFVKDIIRTTGGKAGPSDRLDTSSTVVPYDEVEKYIKSGNFEKLGYQRGTDNDTRYDAEQTWYGDIGRNILGFTANTAGSFAGGLTSLGGLAYQLGKYAIGTDDVRGKDGTRSFNKFIENNYDNPLSRKINEGQRYINEDLAYNFRNQRERDLEANNPVFNLIPFYGNGFGETIRSLGFTAGSLGAMVVSEYLTAGLGNAAVLSKGVGYIPKLAGKMAGAIKSTERIDKMIDGMKSLGIINKLDGAIDAGTFAKQLYTGFDIGLGLKIGARPILRGTVSAMSEASMEALETKDNLYKELVSQYQSTHGGNNPEGKDLEQINQTVTDAANARYIANLAIIGINNSLTFNTLFKNMPLSRKLLGEEFEAGSSRIAIEGGRFVEKTTEKAVSKWSQDPRWYKQLLGKSYDTVRNIGSKGILAPAEAVEEGGQMVAQKATDAYYKYQYNNDDRSFNIFEALKATSNALRETVTTTEGWSAMLQGMLGGIITGGIGGVKKWYEQTRPEYKAQQDKLRDSNIKEAAILNDRFAEILNTNSIGGSISKKVYDIKSQKGIVDELHAAAQQNDQYRFQGHKHDLQFNFVDTFLSSHQSDVMMQQLEDLREFAQKNPDEFNKTYGRDVEGVTVGSPLDTVNELIDLAKDNIKAKEKIDSIMVNPYQNPSTVEDALAYQTFEAYKRELRFNMSKINNYQKRIGILEGEMRGNGSVLNQLLDNETYTQELASIKDEIRVLSELGDKGQANRLQKQYDLIEKMKDNKATPDDIRKYAMDATNIGFRDEVDDLIQKQMDIIELKRATKKSYDLYNKMITGNGFNKFLKEDKDYKESVARIKEQQRILEEASAQAVKNKEIADKKQILDTKVENILKAKNVDIKEFNNRNVVKYHAQFLDANYNINAVDADIETWIDNQIIEDVRLVQEEKDKQNLVSQTVSAIVEEVKNNETVSRIIENTPTIPQQSTVESGIDLLEIGTDLSEIVLDETIDAFDMSEIGDSFINNPTPIDTPTVPPITVNIEQIDTPTFTSREEIEQNIIDKVEERTNIETIDSLTPSRIQEITEEVIQETINPTQNPEDFDSQIHKDWKGVVVFAPYGSGKSTAVQKSAGILMDSDEYVTSILEQLLQGSGVDMNEVKPLLDNYNISRKKIAEQYAITIEELRDAVSQEVLEDLEDGSTILFGSPYYLNENTLKELLEFNKVVTVTVDKDRQRKLSTDISNREFNNDISDEQLSEKIKEIAELDTDKTVELISTPVKTYYIEDIVKSPIEVVNRKFDNMKQDASVNEIIEKQQDIVKQLIGNPLSKLLYDGNTFAYNTRNGNKINFSIIINQNSLAPQQKTDTVERIKQERLNFANALNKGDLSNYEIKYGNGSNVRYGGQVTHHPDLYRRFASGYITIQSKKPIEGTNIHPVVFFLPMENNLYVDSTRPSISYSNNALFGEIPLSEDIYNTTSEATTVSYADYKKLHSEHIAFRSEVKNIQKSMGKDNAAALKAFVELANFKLQATDNTRDTSNPIALKDIQFSNAINPNVNTPNSIVVIEHKNGQFITHVSSNLSRLEENDIIERLSNIDTSNWEFGTSQWIVNFDTVSGAPMFNRVVGRNESPFVVDYITQFGILPALQERLTLQFSTGNDNLARKFRLKLHNRIVNNTPQSIVRIEFNIRDEDIDDVSSLSINVPVDIPNNPTVNNVAQTIFDSFLAAINDNTKTYTYTNRDKQKGFVSASNYFKDALSTIVADEELDNQVEQIFNDFTIASNNPLSIVKPNQTDEEFIANSVVQVSSPAIFDKIYLSASPILPEPQTSKQDIVLPVNDVKPTIKETPIVESITEIQNSTEEQQEIISENILAKIVDDNNLIGLKALDLSIQEYDKLNTILSNIKGINLEQAAITLDKLSNPVLNTTGVQVPHKLDKNSLFKLSDYSSFGIILSTPQMNIQAKTNAFRKLFTYVEAKGTAPYTRLNETVEEELKQLKKNCF